jgi:hypothetical protein
LKIYLPFHEVITLEQLLCEIKVIYKELENSIPASVVQRESVFENITNKDENRDLSDFNNVLKFIDGMSFVLRLMVFHEEVLDLQFQVIVGFEVVVFLKVHANDINLMHRSLTAFVLSCLFIFA